MGLPSVLIAYITVYVQDAAAVKIHGFFGGYNSIVWTVIIVQAVGGLIVATVVKVCSLVHTLSVPHVEKKTIRSHFPRVFKSTSSVCGQRIESLCHIVFHYHFVCHISIHV